MRSRLIGSVTGLVLAGTTGAHAGTLLTLGSFNGANGSNPAGGLYDDGTGTLFGVTQTGGANGQGGVFELTRAGSGSTISTIGSFSGIDNSSVPYYDPGIAYDKLVADSAGNLFGTTVSGGTGDKGTVFELTKAGPGYTLTTLASLGGNSGNYPYSGLIIDSAGNLFGTTSQGGPGGYGTAYELAKTAAGYTPTTLASFTIGNGSNPYGLLLADSAGNLFGATAYGGTANAGTVFELVKSGSGYTVSTLVNFDGTNGRAPIGSLTADSAGNLFGTTSLGGAAADGTAFELVKSAPGYTLATLATFTGANGYLPRSDLTLDSAGNLFGTTLGGGTAGDGTVFELVKSALGYTLSTLVNFMGANGQSPLGAPMLDSAGNLFGTTTNGGAANDGTIYEITNIAGTSVPEPASLLVLAAGVAMLSATRRQRAR